MGNFLSCMIGGGQSQISYTFVGNLALSSSENINFLQNFLIHTFKIHVGSLGFHAVLGMVQWTLSSLISVVDLVYSGPATVSSVHRVSLSQSVPHRVSELYYNVYVACVTCSMYV